MTVCAQVEVKLGIRQLKAFLGQLHGSREHLPHSGLLSGKDSLLIVARNDIGNFSDRARWGLVGSFLDHEPGSPMLNLKCEGLASTPFYGKLLKWKRTLIPVTAFIQQRTQPDGRKRKVRISHPDGQPMMLAGIFDSHPSAGTTCAILTVGADAPASAINGRLPLIVGREDWGLWLDNAPEFPADEVDRIMLARPGGALRVEEVPEPAPSPQLCFAFA